MPSSSAVIAHAATVISQAMRWSDDTSAVLWPLADKLHSVTAWRHDVAAWRAPMRGALLDRMAGLFELAEDGLKGVPERDRYVAAGRRDGLGRVEQQMHLPA